MKHPTSRLLHAYWDRLRGERASPERGEIEPGEIRNLLADSMILEVAPAERVASMRLAGTRVCALFGRELKGVAFADLWGPRASEPWRLVDTVASDTVGLVAGLRGLTTRDEAVELELLLLPLRYRGRTQERVLGSLSPGVVPEWLGVRPVIRIETTTLRILGAEDARAARLAGVPQAANDPLPVRRGHLLVHEGGRA